MLEFNSDNYLKIFFKTDAWWRPLKNIFYNFFNQNFYLLASPIVATKIIIHALFTIIIFNFLKKFQNNLSTILLSLLFFFLQSSFSSSILIDTLGQLLVSFFGVISFFFTYSYVRKPSQKKYLNYSYLFIVFAFLSKEIAVTFVMINIFTLIYHSKFNIIFNYDKVSKIDVLKISLIFVFLVILYLLIRNFLGATWQPTNLGSDRYSLGIGINVLKNFFQYFFSIINPVDNLFIYLIYQNKNILFISIVVIFFVFYILYLTRRFISNFGPETFFRFLIFLISCLPIILLNKIGELYTYSSSFFFIFFLQKILLKKGNIILILLLFINFFSILNKIDSVNIISNQKKNIDKFFKQIDSELRTKDLYVLHNKSKFKYSYYHLPSFDWIYPSFQFKKDYGKSYILVIDEEKINQEIIENSIIIRSTEFENRDFSLRNKICFNFIYSSKKTICNF
jgi:hypothetical protein